MAARILENEPKNGQVARKMVECSKVVGNGSICVEQVAEANNSVWLDGLSKQREEIDAAGRRISLKSSKFGPC